MDLDLRKQRILQAIVQDYVATAEPVGSQVLVERYSLGVKSATIRNEMAEMSDRGYLRQPHTSAGRVPSDRGYRFYVNRLMTLPVVQTGESDRIKKAVESASTELDSVLRQTCRLLADMTHLPAVATPPDADDTVLRQIFVTPASAEKTLVVLLFSTGRTENRLLNVALSASDALQLANALNSRLGGKPVAALRAGPGLNDAAPPDEIARHNKPWRQISEEIYSAARNLGAEVPVYLEGTHAALRYPEFRDVERLGMFLSTLQERAALLELLGSALNVTGPRVAVHVSIGEEMGRPEMVDYAVVTSAYFVGGKERGSIGVVGPSRMDYGRASAAVDLMARTVGELLTSLSVS